MSSEVKETAGKLPSASIPAVPAPLLSQALAFLAGGFCFMAGGFRLTADDKVCYEVLNRELPKILEWQIEWGAKLGVLFLAAGLAFVLLCRCRLPVRTSTSGRAVQASARGLVALAALGAVVVSFLVLWSGELIFTQLQTALVQ